MIYKIRIKIIDKESTLVKIFSLTRKLQFIIYKINFEKFDKYSILYLEIKGGDKFNLLLKSLYTITGILSIDVL